jgi:hypothetical protein
MAEFVLGNVFVREMVFEALGKQVIGHAHNFDHVTYVVSGGLRIEVLEPDTGGEVIETLMVAGVPTLCRFRIAQSREIWADKGRNFVLIKAGVRHRITSLGVRAMGHCIYSHRDAQGEVQLEYDGFRSPYV